MWANRGSVPDRSLIPSAIACEEQVDWFATTGDADDVGLLIIDARRLPVGQLRFELRDGQAAINDSLDACARGRGRGREIVERGSVGSATK
jgi:UDP-2,4-diacetamido-2,4,6-trideoxy-beta-L-altropyranose hydrolase